MSMILVPVGGSLIPIYTGNNGSTDTRPSSYTEYYHDPALGLNLSVTVQTGDEAQAQAYFSDMATAMGLQRRTPAQRRHWGNFFLGGLFGLMVLAFCTVIFGLFLPILLHFVRVWKLSQVDDWMVMSVLIAMYSAAPVTIISAITSYLAFKE